MTRHRYAVIVAAEARRELGLKPHQAWIGVMREVQGEWSAYYLAQTTGKGWQWVFVAEGNIHKPCDVRCLEETGKFARRAIQQVAAASCAERNLMAARYARLTGRCSVCGRVMHGSPQAGHGHCPRCTKRAT
ncbi:MAG: hypothetical protein KIT45_06745 [Fimbriimonadia bacterium]|nr:hypothetical protein [Fimbriimonadia bacterium]